MLDSSIHAGSGVIAGTVVLQSEAMSLRQEIGELIMYESGKVETFLLAMPITSEDIVLEFRVPIAPGARQLAATLKAPSKDVSIVLGEVVIADNQTARLSVIAMPNCPVIVYAF